MLAKAQLNLSACIGTTPAPRGGAARWFESRDAFPGLSSPPLPGLRQTLPGQLAGPQSARNPPRKALKRSRPIAAIITQFETCQQLLHHLPPRATATHRGPPPVPSSPAHPASAAGSLRGCWPLEPGRPGAAAQTETGFSGQFSFSINAWSLPPAPPFPPASPLLVSGARPACDK